jgi:hypothetical protein
MLRGIFVLIIDLIINTLLLALVLLCTFLWLRWQQLI